MTPANNDPDDARSAPWSAWGAGEREISPCPPGWHPGPRKFEQLDRVYLDEHPEVRERWWRTLYFG